MFSAVNRLPLVLAVVCFSRAAPAADGSSQVGVELELQPPAYTTATAA